VVATLRHPEVMRYFLLSSHYRQPINYSLDQLEQADAALNRIYTALRDLPTDVELREGEHTRRFHEAMDDDFNTPEAIAVLQGLARELNAARGVASAVTLGETAAELKSLGGVLGILQVPSEQWFRGKSAGGLSDTQIDGQIAARLAARKAKNWAESDRIRNELAEAGVILEDKPGGTTSWRRA